MRQFDEDMDGRLSYKEFKMAILPQNDPTTAEVSTSHSNTVEATPNTAEEDKKA